MMKFQIYWGNLQSRFRQRCLEASNLDFLANIQRRPWLTRTLILENPRAELGSQETRSRTADSLVGAQCVVYVGVISLFSFGEIILHKIRATHFLQPPLPTTVEHISKIVSCTYRVQVQAFKRHYFNHVSVKATIARIIH